MSQDKAEFAEFFAASWDACLRAVAASTGNMTLAEDQVAEAFARAWAAECSLRKLSTLLRLTFVTSAIALRSDWVARARQMGMSPVRTMSRSRIGMPRGGG